MRRAIRIFVGSLVTCAGLLVAGAMRADAQEFEVTITNLTRGQQFTPILVASHKEGVSLFELGDPASSELATVAEEGDTAPLQALLEADPGVLDVQVGSALTDPGSSTTLKVQTQGGFNRVSVVAMLIPTNDGFFALSGVKGPAGNGTLVFYSPGYDSGSERNDETCENIPGPFFEECGGPGGGGAPSGGEEGYVHINAAIHGIGDMRESQRDWRNPVARIVVKRLP